MSCPRWMCPVPGGRVMPQVGVLHVGVSRWVCHVPGGCRFPSSVCVSYGYTNQLCTYHCFNLCWRHEVRSLSYSRLRWGEGKQSSTMNNECRKVESEQLCSGVA